jgi:hypothetical protein
MEGAYTDFKLDFLSVFPSEKVVANSFDGYEVVSGNVNDNFNDDDIEYYVVNNKFSYLSAFDMCKYFAETKMIYNYIKPTRSYNYNRVLVDKLKDFDSFRSGRNYNNDYFHCLGIICNGNKYCMVNINPNSYYDPYRSEYSILYINEEPICSFTKYGINKVSSTFENNGYFKGDITCVEPPTETTTYTQPSSSYSSSNSSSYSSSKKYNNYQYYYSDDPYNIDDYDDPEDFYYDNEDDFEDYEDAEDYFYEAKGE